MSAAATYEEIAPPPALSRHVDACWFYQVELDAPRPDVLIPEGVVDLIFNFGAPYYREPITPKGSGEWVSSDVFAGQRTHLFSIEWPKDTRLFAIRLKPEAAYLFIDQPMHEISNLALPLRGTRLEALSQAVHSLPFEDRKGIAACSFDLMIQLVSRLGEPDARISTMINAIQQHQGSVDIRSLCDQSGFNRRTIERLFADRVGLSPKFLARTIRVHHFLCMRDSNSGTKFSDGAVEAQYYDQSHLIREFKQFTGESPAKFYDSPPEIYVPLLTSLLARRGSGSATVPSDK